MKILGECVNATSDSIPVMLVYDIYAFMFPWRKFRIITCP